MLSFENSNKYKSDGYSPNDFLVIVKESFLRGMINFKEAQYRFEIDPSLTTRDPGHFELLIKYLYKKSLHIDVWDADTLMLYGTIKVLLLFYLVFSIKIYLKLIKFLM